VGTWVRNGLTLFTADDYKSKVLSIRGGAGERVGYEIAHIGRGFQTQLGWVHRPRSGPPADAPKWRKLQTPDSYEVKSK
jgi:hypothetical protein